MIEFNLTGDQHIAILEYSHNILDIDMQSYISATFHGKLDLKMDARVTDPDFWGTISFNDEADLNWFKLKWI